MTDQTNRLFIDTATCQEEPGMRPARDMALRPALPTLGQDAAHGSSEPRTTDAARRTSGGFAT